MKQRDNALKQFLKSKMECEKQHFYKLRNRVIMRLEKQSIYNCHGAHTKEEQEQADEDLNSNNNI